MPLPLGPLRFLYRKAAFPLMGLGDAEDAHHLALQFLAASVRVPAATKAVRDQARAPSGRLTTRLFGIDFPSPLGLAAGFDKNGVAAGALIDLGFGFVEVGTVTPQPQAGNPRPRM